MKDRDLISVVRGCLLSTIVLLSACMENTPVVSTTIIYNINQVSATSGGNVSDDGGSSILARGICWSESNEPTVLDNKTIEVGGLGSFTSTLIELTPNTTYYVKAYATNDVGTSYGNLVTFTTEEVERPELSTADISEISLNSAVSGGNITSDGGSTITARGVCWSLSENPTINDQKTSDGTGSGVFKSTLNELFIGSKHYARAYATNSAGTAYGNQIEFTTLLTPTVELMSISWDNSNATFIGNVTKDGGSEVISRGFCWSTVQNPTILGNRTVDGSGLGEYTGHISGLIPGTKYYVRAYATNSGGTSYSRESSFTTGNISTIPILTTNSVTSITQTTANCGGNISNDGGAFVEARGVCWSTNQYPTIDNNKISNGTGTGSFDINLTGLTANTTYFVRAFARNSAGVGYGNQVSFTTKAIATLPSVSTSAVTSVTQTTAAGGGTVLSDGGSTVTARGICWSISQNPTISDNKTSIGNGTGIFASSITGLTAGTTYYVRAYATNSIGTSYGQTLSFTTNPEAPTITTNSVTYITSTSAYCIGVITSDGGAEVITKGFCWSTSQNPTISNSKTDAGSGSGNFGRYIYDLNEGTTYYVRAYATNSVGTAYGNQISFTTTPGLPTVTTNVVSSITTHSAISGGTITSDGGSAIISKGVCWRISPDPTISNTKTDDGSGSGNFSSNITSLSESTSYYVRAYATNSQGTSYGQTLKFTTLTPSGLVNGLISYWNIDEINGTVVRDQIGTNNCYVQTGVSINQNGLIGRAVSFVETSGGLTTGKTATQLGISGNTSKSFSIWIKPNSSINGLHSSGIIDLGSPENQQQFGIKYYGDPAYWMFDSWFGAVRIGENSNNLADGKWHHIVVTYNSTNHTVRTYLDGVLMTLDSSKILNTGTTTPLSIGIGSQGKYPGLIDEVGIWSRALTDAEVQSLFNYGNGLQYPFD